MRIENLTKKVRRFGKETVEEVQKLNEVRQLNGKINDTRKQIEHLYAEIGKRIYSQYKDSALTGFENEIVSITANFEKIEELKIQVRKVKGVDLCPCCNMEVALDERFCSNCGTKMPEKENEEAVSEDAEVVTEVASEEPETVEIVNEVAEESEENPVEVVMEDEDESIEDSAETEVVTEG